MNLQKLESPLKLGGLALAVLVDARGERVLVVYEQGWILDAVSASLFVAPGWDNNRWLADALRKVSPIYLL
jgi:hypothetical protein